MRALRRAHLRRCAWGSSPTASWVDATAVSAFPSLARLKGPHEELVAHGSPLGAPRRAGGVALEGDRWRLHLRQRRRPAAGRGPGAARLPVHQRPRSRPLGPVAVPALRDRGGDGAGLRRGRVRRLGVGVAANPVPLGPRTGHAARRRSRGHCAARLTARSTPTPRCRSHSTPERPDRVPYRRPPARVRPAAGVATRRFGAALPRRRVARKVWLSGNEPGTSRAAQLPYEFDVGSVLRPGQNVLARVHRWSSGTYLEDQDMWWLPGIFREVELLELAARRARRRRRAGRLRPCQRRRDAAHRGHRVWTSPSSGSAPPPDPQSPFPSAAMAWPGASAVWVHAAVGRRVAATATDWRWWSSASGRRWSSTARAG